MKRLLIALALLGASLVCAHAQGTQLCYSNGNNCAPGIQATKSVPINTADAATTELIALDTNKSIYVTGWDLISAGITNVTFKYGTGTACGTGTASLTGAYGLVANSFINKGIGLGVIWLIPKGNALCITNSQAIQISGSLSYTQF